MKRTIRLICFLTIVGVIYSCDTSNDVIPNSSRISDSLQIIITKDAYHLTHKYLAIDSSYNNDIEFPDEIFSVIYSGLLSLYQANDPVLDSILYMYPTHCNPSPSLKRLVIYVDNTVGWSNTWYEDNLISSTNDTILNKLINITNAELYHSAIRSNGFEFRICFQQHLNLHALKKEFLNIDGIWNVDFDVFVVRSLTETDIDIDIQPNGIIFTFIRKLGSIVSGSNQFICTKEVFVSNTGIYEILN